MPAAFLVASIVGVLFVLNARRALRLPILVVPAFFASWLTLELAPQLLVIHAIAVALFAIYGGLEAWPGWVALGLSGVTAYLLWGLVRESYRVKEVLDEALEDEIGPDAAHVPVAWKEFAFPFKLWSRKIRRARNIPYSDRRGRRHRLDVWYDADADDAARPCLLYVPGGAWTSLISNKNHQGKPLLIEMASRGWVCFAMNYPVSPRATYPDHIIAVKKAIAWIRKRAQEYGGDPDFLMVSGNSAGGHLSSLAALTPNDPDLQPGFEDEDTTVQAAVPCYGIYDFTHDLAKQLSRAERWHKAGSIRFLELNVMKRRLRKEREFFERASPWHRVGPHAPPFFVIHGAMDTLALASEARAFVERLREVSREPVVHAELPGAQHAFDIFLSIRSIHTVRAVARFGEWAHQRWEARRDPDRLSDAELDRS